MDWNNFFMSGTNPNYNFVPGGFPPVGNNTLYQNGNQNWRYYPGYNQNYISEPPSLQPIIPPVISPSPYGGVFTPNSRDFREGNVRPAPGSAFQSASGSGIRMNDTFNTPVDALASILAVSSLTPTAGEFVPRSRNVEQCVSEHSAVTQPEPIVTSASFTSAKQQCSETKSANDVCVSQSVAKEFNDSVSNNEKSEASLTSHGKNTDQIGDIPEKKKSNTFFQNNASDGVKVSSGEPRNSQSGANRKNAGQGQNSISNKKSGVRVLQNDINGRNMDVEDEARRVHGSSNKAQLQDMPIRKGSGRIPQNRVGENVWGSNMQDSKNQGRQRLLAQAASFCYSSDDRQDAEGGSGGSAHRKGPNERQNYARDNAHGKNSTRETGDKFFSGRSYYNQFSNRGDSKALEASDNFYNGYSFRERDNYVAGRTFYKYSGSNRSERGGKNERGDRFERGDRSERSDRFERGDRPERGDRFERGDRQERGDRPERVDRSERGDRFERNDRAERVDRFEKGEKGDTSEKQERSERRERNERCDRRERNEQGDRGADRSDTGKHQKTFFNNRYNSRNYDSPSNGRDTWFENNSPYFHNRSRRYPFTQNSNEQKADNENLSPTRNESDFNQKYGVCISDKQKALHNGDRDSHGHESNNIAPDSFKSANRYGKEKTFADDDASQRERLSEQLFRGALECLVCCERVRQNDAVWSCSNCYHVLHLRCIKKWAKSSKAESGWRCPACQNVTSKVPQEYRCFCGKMRDPEWNRQDVPHSCGEVCGRGRAPRAPELGKCTHRCTLLCHPGPCPPCVAQVNRECGCGKTSQVVSCGSAQPLQCEATCDRVLNCGLHRCNKICHWGSCGDCEEVVKQACFCGKASREVPCVAETAAVEHYSCKEMCGQKLGCGNHTCDLVCHAGPCAQCELTPDRVKRCPCGKTALGDDCERSSCLDPVPTCGQPCGKRLKCGQPGNFHECQAECHSGPCPPCPMTTFVKCRCGHMDREIDCKDLTTKADDARCEKRCSKKRACGKHKCNQTCCIDVDHQCPLICNHMLSCGRHRCEELCHRGHCQPCWRTSFEELYCECGASVIFPPVPCGTRRPTCTKPCSRRHPCDHPALHQCHSEPSCPPCTVLMEKYCYGKHELRKAVPCHQTEFSCGMPCGLPLPCGRHTCILPCHKGQCLREGQPLCTQPCKTTRPLCGHACAAPCHEGPCPDTPCKETVRVTCECGHRSTTRPCCDQTKEYRRVMTAMLASKMQDVQLGHSVDIGDLSGSPTARAMSLKTLECNDECKIIERNRRLAIGLQIRNPDLSCKLQPRYSDFLRQWGKKDTYFVSMVHDKLTELVQLAKQSKQKSRSYSFSSMNREKRQFIHEYCEHFGCESQAYDPEPNRNVVATAQRDKAWLPSMSLLEVLQRESGQRKVPKPVTARTVDTKLKETSLLRSTLQKPNEANNKLEEKDKEKEKEKEPEEGEIDYFECTS